MTRAGIELLAAPIERLLSDPDADLNEPLRRRWFGRGCPDPVAGSYSRSSSVGVYLWVLLVALTVGSLAATPGVLAYSGSRIRLQQKIASVIGLALIAATGILISPHVSRPFTKDWWGVVLVVLAALSGNPVIRYRVELITSAAESALFGSASSDAPRR
jgi:hypothetical protein